MNLSFIDQIKQGLITNPEEAVDDFIEQWHHNNIPFEKLSLHQFLGMTWTEYADWVEGTRTLEEIVNG